MSKRLNMKNKYTTEKNGSNFMDCKNAIAHKPTRENSS